MAWKRSYRADPRSRVIADRHYNRQSHGAANFVPPGRCLVLRAETETGVALWVTSFPFAQYVKHAWAGAWVCSAFRNEGAGLSSGLILDAIAATRARFGEPPELGMITFVDPTKVRSTRVRGKRVYGFCFLKAGFRHVGFTKGGLYALQMLPEDMPEAREPASDQFTLPLAAACELEQKNRAATIGRKSQPTLAEGPRQ